MHTNSDDAPSAEIKYGQETLSDVMSQYRDTGHTNLEGSYGSDKKHELLVTHIE
jgi:hypothetical protein